MSSPCATAPSPGGYDPLTGQQTSKEGSGYGAALIDPYTGSVSGNLQDINTNASFHTLAPEQHEPWDGLGSHGISTSQSELDPGFMDQTFVAELGSYPSGPENLPLGLNANVSHATEPSFGWAPGHGYGQPGTVAMSGNPLFHGSSNIVGSSFTGFPSQSITTDDVSMAIPCAVPSNGQLVLDDFNYGAILPVTEPLHTRFGAAHKNASMARAKSSADIPKARRSRAPAPAGDPLYSRHLVSQHASDGSYGCLAIGCEKSFKRWDKCQEHMKKHHANDFQAIDQMFFGAGVN
ncbi:MAG: hypothetical protein Q9190_003023 [Brigantiaea leucoxantha]